MDKLIEKKLAEFDERFEEGYDTEIGTSTDGYPPDEQASELTHYNALKSFLTDAMREAREGELKKLLQLVIEDVPHQYQDRLLKELNH